jgi:NAD(P)-dependent dehydrogenase (short-subunit alcohol dehydrogenase family)
VTRSVSWISGKQVVITGATSGIGRAAAEELARRGARINLVARNLDKATAVAGDVSRDSGGEPRTFRADLAQLGQVRAVAAEIAEELGPIDVLVNNAGVAARKDHLTDEGWDEMLAANYLGPWLLTHLLLEKLRAGAPSRIVITGSEAHRLTGRFDPEHFEQMGHYSGLGAQLAYGRTKLLDILWAEELARRLDGSKVTVSSLCPGLVSTGLFRDVPGAQRLGDLVSATPFIRTPAQGARMLIHLAAEDAAEEHGRFRTSTPGASLLPTTGPRRHPAVAKRVYERTAQLLGVEPV